jgi:hypothetical protein
MRPPGARVVGLENRHRSNPIASSNLALSANKNFVRRNRRAPQKGQGEHSQALFISRSEPVREHLAAVGA